MSTTLYKEALLEVDSLKRMAEENAKNKIIEAVTPKIRALIESQLLGEDAEIEEDLDLDVIDLGSIPVEPAAVAPAVSEDSAKIKIDVQGDLNIDMDASPEAEIEDLLLGQEVGDVVENYILGKRNPKRRIAELSRKVATLSALLETVDLRKASPAQVKIATLYYAKLVNEATRLVSGGIIMEESVDLRLLSQLKTIIKEIKHMANRRDAIAFRRLLEELEADESLSEMMKEEDEETEEVEDEAEVSVDEEPAPVDVPAAQDALGDLAAALGMEAEVEEEVTVTAQETEEVAVDEEPLDLGEADEADHSEADDKDLDEVYEIDEAALKRELLRMREGLEAEAGAEVADVDEFENVGNPLDAQADFGGSEETLEVSEEDLVEALHAELSRSRRPSRRRVRTENRRPRRRTKASASRRKSSTALRENAKLRAQLNEMNVFNAKLLFANKLMQNRDLSKKQQRAIVEALDSAKTINEAKLLYKSLSASLTKSGNLSEGKNRLLASSSRSTRSASPAQNGVDGGRWALLAGLASKDNS